MDLPASQKLELPKLTGGRIDIPIADGYGGSYGQLRIYGDCDNLSLLEDSEARELGEAAAQVIEQSTFEYEVDSCALALEPNPLFMPSLIEGREHTGTFSTGNRVGLLRIQFLDESASRVAFVELEVTSRKIDYRSAYRQMLADIAKFNTHLVLQLNSATSARLTPQYLMDSESNLQRLLVVLGLVADRDIQDAMDQIIARPHSLLRSRTEMVHPGKRIRFGPASYRSFATGRNRVSAREGSDLSSRFEAMGFPKFSLPRVLEHVEHEASLDTNENQFVKSTLTTIDAFLGQVEISLNTRKETRVIAERELRPVRDKIETWLSEGLFLEVTDSQTVPTHSVVLQRKPGYREVYELWLAFEAAMSLDWIGGEQIVNGGIRDLPTLYEYWVYFTLLEVLSELTGAFDPQQLTSQLYVMDKGGLHFRLRRGEVSICEGETFEWNGTTLSMSLFYNRTFSPSREGVERKRLEYQRHGGNFDAWTRQMRPDYTLVIHASGLSQEEAVGLGNFTAIHFDAKYSVDHLKELFGSTDDEEDQIKSDENAGTYRRGDLLKMHTYKDAIRRSSGAFILYPGIPQLTPDQQYVAWMQYHEILPGIGAFCLRPGADKDACKKVLSSFVRDVLDQVVN